MYEIIENRTKLEHIDFNIVRYLLYLVCSSSMFFFFNNQTPLGGIDFIKLFFFFFVFLTTIEVEQIQK